MANYAKLKNGQLEMATKMVASNNQLIYNPTEDKLIEFGYKEYVPTEMLPQKEWYIQTASYSETDMQIIQEWNYVKLPEPDYKQLVVSKIRERYDINDEISLGYKQESDEFAEYREYVLECKQWATQQISNYNEVDEPTEEN